MDDVRYRKEKERIRKLIKRWQQPMGLRWFKINLEFDRNCSRDGTHTQALTDMSCWRYHEFTITFFITDTMGLSDDDLENTVVHELAHCMLAPISCNMRETDKNSDYRRDIMEFNTQLVANAMQWVRTAGKDDHVAELKAKAKSDTLKSSSKAQGE